MALPPRNADEIPVARTERTCQNGPRCVEGIGFEHLPSCFATFFHRENGEIRPKERSQNLIVTLKKVTWNTSNGPKAGTHTCVYELWMGTFTYPEADAFA